MAPPERRRSLRSASRRMKRIISTLWWTATKTTNFQPKKSGGSFFTDRPPPESKALTHEIDILGIPPLTLRFLTASPAYETDQRLVWLPRQQFCCGAGTRLASRT